MAVDGPLEHVKESLKVSLLYVRKFDSILELEWRSVRRKQQFLCFVMF